MKTKKSTQTKSQVKPKTDDFLLRFRKMPKVNTSSDPKPTITPKYAAVTTRQPALWLVMRLSLGKRTVQKAAWFLDRMQIPFVGQLDKLRADCQSAPAAIGNRLARSHPAPLE